jgi:hypothetical protein
MKRRALTFGMAACLIGTGISLSACHDDRPGGWGRPGHDRHDRDRHDRHDRDDRHSGDWDNRPH